MRILLDPAPGDGGGNPPPADPTKAFEAALAKFNGDNAALARDSWQAAERLRAERDELKGKVPAKDARILSKDEDAAYAAFLSLGVKPDEVGEKLRAGDEAVTWRSARERKDRVGEAGKLHGYDAEVLETLVGDLPIEFKEVARNGKPARIAEVVTKEGDKEVRTPLDKHAEKAWAKFLPSLKVAGTTAVPGNAQRRVSDPPPAINTDAPRPKLAGL